MEQIILLVRLLLRRAWRGTQNAIRRYRLNALPPVRTSALVLVLGLGIPMAMGIDRRPSALAYSLAIQRLKAFDGSMPSTGPEAGTYCLRPAFHWPKHSTAARYRFRLYDGDVERHHTERVMQPGEGAKQVVYLLPAPGSLEQGHSYRFSVEALDEKGARLGQVAYSAFQVKEAHEELKRRREQAHALLEPDEAALVEAGMYAELGSVHDLCSALSRYLDLAPKGADADLAGSLLAR